MHDTRSSHYCIQFCAVQTPDMLSLLLLWSVVIVFALPCVALACARIYVKSRTKWDKSYTCLVGKTTIVTGANTGIGYCTALEFAKRGGRVILACRDEARGTEARDKIISATRNSNVVLKILNLSSFDSVRKFCKDINDNEDRLDILVNNAGTAVIPKRLTEDGFQLTLQVNYLSPFLLTHLLVDKLKKSAPSRIVNTSSMGASRDTLDLQDYNYYPKSGSRATAAWTIYCRSKQAGVLFYRLLADRLSGTKVTTYSHHPGVIMTDIWRNVSFKKVSYFIMDIFMKNCEEGVQTQLYCSLAPELENVSGKFYEECREIPMYKTCRDMKFAEDLWDLTEKLVGLQEHEKIPKL